MTTPFLVIIIITNGKITTLHIYNEGNSRFQNIHLQYGMIIAKLIIHLFFAKFIL